MGEGTDSRLLKIGGTPISKDFTMAFKKRGVGEGRAPGASTIGRLWLLY